MKNILLIILLIIPTFAFGEILNCRVVQASMLNEDGTLGAHLLFEGLSTLPVHFMVDTSSGEVSGAILINTLPICSVRVTGGGDDDTVITSPCGGQVEYIRMVTYKENNPFVAIDWIKGIYSGTCKQP